MPVITTGSRAGCGASVVGGGGRLLGGSGVGVGGGNSLRASRGARASFIGTGLGGGGGSAGFAGSGGSRGAPTTWICSGVLATRRGRTATPRRETPSAARRSNEGPGGNTPPAGPAR